MPRPDWWEFNQAKEMMEELMKEAKLNVLKNTSDEECWFEEQVKEIEKQGDARKAIEEWMDEKTDTDRQAKD